MTRFVLDFGDDVQTEHGTIPRRLVFDTVQHVEGEPKDGEVALPVAEYDPRDHGRLPVVRWPCS